MNEVAANPFANSALSTRQAGSNAVANTDQHRAIAEVQAAMMIARMNPRDPIAAVDRILNACTRPSLADSAVYTYARGGSDVSGPSIRLAEAMAQQWGNIKTSVRELDQQHGVSTVQAIAWDLETGYQCDKVFHVPHIRHTKNGSKNLEDPRDIYELVANQGARRLRACILAVIPGDVTEAAVAQCETTMKTKADTSPDAMKKMIEAFDAFGVSKEQIEKRIQRRLDAIQPAQVVSLKKIYASLRDGMSAAADWFEPEQVEEQGQNAAGASRTDTIKEKLKAKKEPTRTDPQDEQLKAVETGTAGSIPPMTYAEVATQLEKATTRDAFDLACDLIQNVADLQQREELGGIVKRRLAEFKAAE